jgi:hypothetical protein
MVFVSCHSQGNRKALFIWNEVNYLLKMPSDLDFLDEYPVIRKELFPLTRNPFCIPYPLESASQVQDSFAGKNSIPSNSFIQVLSQLDELR